MIRLDGSIVAQERKTALTERVAAFTSKTHRKPGLAVIIVGADSASQVYVRNKVKTTTEVGMARFHFELPLPAGINADLVTEAILPEKDPDGLTTGNLGRLFSGRKRVAPCTPFGVMAILEHYKIPLKGRRAVVIGRSNIVGKPMAQLLLEADATVTICHSRTIDLLHHTLDAEIVVVAAGRPRFLGSEAFAKGSTVIDVGIHRPSEGPFAGKLCGDVRFEELEHVGAATPVPKGVGPMTIQMLMENTLHLAELREGFKR
jgi:methylenetetrahydrofolate dehydrogenase (NADP+)/methenyltetrahydrofolate cyclohydrolase